MTVGKTAAQTYNVFSHRSGRYYHVKRTRENTWSCTCLHYQNRKTYCRHIRAAEDVSGIRRLRGGRKMVIGPVDPVVCRKGCASGVIKKGWRRTARGRVQRYACKACGARLTASMGFEGMRVPPEIIGAAISMYFNGESYRDVAETVGMLGYPVTHKAVMNWVEKFIPLIASYLASIRPRVSGRWRTDEMHMKVSGETSYLYAIIDDESRFWISAQMAPAKDTANIKPLMRDSMRLTGRNPDVLTSDGGPQIKKACDDVYRAPGIARKSDHERHIHIAGDKNNNKMESFVGGVRDREKTMRSVKRADSPIIEGMRTHYNTKPHMGLGGMSPYDRMGIIIEGDNKWVTLIQNAEKFRIENSAGNKSKPRKKQTGG